MKREHSYFITLEWTGNRGVGTSGYRDFDRNHTIYAKNKTSIECSSDPAFLGDNTKYNPEELLLSSLAACHMLWYLHLCATSKVVVMSYSDTPRGLMVEESNGRGRFTEVVLNPMVTVEDETMIQHALEIHEQASANCFIANSVNFPVRYHPICRVQSDC